MHFIYTGICFFGTIAAMAIIKSLDLGTGPTLVLLIPLLFLFIYGLAWSQSKDTETEQDASKITHP